MKSTALSALLVIGLAACNQHAAPDANADKPKPKPAAAATAPAAAVEPRLLEAALPSGLQLQFPYHLRSDRVVERRNGNAQRLVVVESLTADLATTLQEVKKTLRAGEFQLVPAAADAKPEEDGTRVLTFRKKDFPGLVVVRVTPARERELRHPKAVATVAFAFDTDAAPTAPAAAPATTPATPAADPANAAAPTAAAADATTPANAAGG